MVCSSLVHFEKYLSPDLSARNVLSHGLHLIHDKDNYFRWDIQISKNPCNDKNAQRNRNKVLLK